MQYIQLQDHYEELKFRISKRIKIEAYLVPRHCPVLGFGRVSPSASNPGASNPKCSRFYALSSIP